MFNSGDILLFALSAKRRVSWPIFKQWFEEVHQKAIIEGQGEVDVRVASIRWQALRTMSCLGHIDLHFDKGDIQVVAAPPLLAALPSRGSTRAVLCGARSPNTVGKLQEAASTYGVEILVGSQEASNPYVPTRVALCADSTANIHDVAASIDLRFIDFPPARSLARVSISIQEYRKRLTWSKETELNWHREDYDPVRLQFLPRGETAPQTRLSRYQNPTTSIWHYQLRRSGEWTDIELDWGRYAILALSSHRVLKYDWSTRRVYVPLGAPLPTLLARAFGLCNGQFSTLFECMQSQTAQRYYVYDDVPPSVFKTVANKLAQQTPAMGARQWMS